MRNNVKLSSYVGLLLLATAGITGCQSDEVVEQGNSYAPSYRIVVDAGKGVDSVATRLLRERPDHLLDSYWEVGDKLMAYRINDNNKSTATAYSLLSSLDAGQNARFLGDISTVSGNFSLTDEICFFYPGTAAVGDDKTLEPTTASTDHHEATTQIKNRVEVNLTTQDGTLATLGRKYDYQWAKARPTAINGTELHVSFGKMERQVAIWGVRFANAQGEILTDIDSIYVSNVRSRDVFDLGTGQFVGYNTDNNSTIVLKPTDGTRLTSAGGRYTYFATLPGAFEDVLFAVYSKGKMYENTYSAVTLEKDHVYHTNVLGMTEVVKKPYVEVQGVKWATGNFIHYTDPATQAEYWGIAPTQWWMSRYAYDSNGTLVSSNFLSDYTMEATDNDLWRWGAIENALKLNGSDFKNADVNLAKVFYKTDGANNTHVGREEAKCGDLVWYHTMNDNQKYRWPSESEMNTLYSQANIVPAWCYTDRGTRVMGAYITTNNGEPRIKGFTTGRGVANLYKYTNVTALVQAGKGLFLPIAGRRMLWQAIVGYRNILAGNAFGKYWAGSGGGAFQGLAFMFGATQWSFHKEGKAQASAIRPVWDEESTSDPNPVFPAFEGIR